MEIIERFEIEGLGADDDDADDDVGLGVLLLDKEG